MTDGWFTKAFGAHYPLLYQHRDTAEARRCLDLLPLLAPLASGPDKLVLDLGCGDGRHLEILGKLGYSGVGLDLSAELLGLAGSQGDGDSHARLVRGDMRRLPFARASFSSVLSLFTAFGYFGPSAANRGPVREVARVLVPGGHWFLDYFDGDQVRRELGGGEWQVRERDLGPLTVREERKFLVTKSLVVKRVRLSARPGQKSAAADLAVPDEGLEYTEQVAVFSLKELDDMAAEEGLFRVGSAGGYEGQPMGGGSRWILAFCKDPKDVTT